LPQNGNALFRVEFAIVEIEQDLQFPRLKDGPIRDAADQFRNQPFETVVHQLSVDRFFVRHTSLIGGEADVYIGKAADVARKYRARPLCVVRDLLILFIGTRRGRPSLRILVALSG
jgi:hypothetical protein